MPAVPGSSRSWSVRAAAQRPVRVLGHRRRCPEYRQRCVALELVDPAVMVSDDLDHHRKEGIEELDDLLRRLLGRDLGRADDVDEEGGDLAGLPAELDLLLERLACYVLADVAPE